MGISINGGTPNQPNMIIYTRYASSRDAAHGCVVELPTALWPSDEGVHSQLEEIEHNYGAL